MEFLYELIDRNKDRLYSTKKGAARIYARHEVLHALEDLKDCVKGIKISALKDERAAAIAAEEIILFCSNKTNELFCSNETNEKDKRISFFFAGVDQLLYDSPIEINHFRKTGDITYRTRRGGDWKLYRGEHLNKLVLKHESVAGNSTRSEEAQPALPLPSAKGKETAPLRTQDYGQSDLSLLSERNDLTASRPMPYGPMLGGNAANRERLQIWQGVRNIDAVSYQTGEILLSQLLKKNIYQVGRGRDKIDESLPKIDEYFQDAIDITALKASPALAEETAKKFIRFCLIMAGPTSRQRINYIRGYDALLKEHFPFRIDYLSANPAHATYQATQSGEKKDYFVDDQLNEIEDPRKKIQRYRMVASLQYELFKESDGEQRSKLATALKSTLAASVPDAVQVRWLSEVNEYLQRKNALKSHPLSVGELGTRQRSPQDAHNELSLLTEEAQGEHATVRDEDAIRDISPESRNVSRPTSASSVISPTKAAIPREKSPNGGAQAAQPEKLPSGGRPYQNAPVESQIPVRAPTRFDNDGIYRIINNERKNFQQDSLDKNREAREFLGEEDVWDRKSLETCVKKRLHDFMKALRETGYNPFYIDKLYALTEFFCDPGMNSPSDLADGVKAADYICDKVVTTDEIDPWRKSCFMMHRVKIAEQEDRIVDARSFRIWAGKLVGQDGVPESNRWNVNMEIAKDKKIPRDQRLLSAISAFSAAENNPRRVLLASQEVADLWRINVSIPVDFEKRGAFDFFMQKTESSEGAREREENAKSAVQFASNPNQIFRAAFLAFDPLQANHDNDYYLALALAHVNTLESVSKKNQVQVNNACRARGMDPRSLDDLVKAFTSDSAGQDPGNPEEGNGMRYPPPPPQYTDSLAMSLSSETSSIIETPKSMSSEFSSYFGSEYSFGNVPQSQYSFSPVGLVNSSPSTGTWSTSVYGGTSAGLDIESMRRIMSVDRRNWRHHNPDTYEKASKFLQREKIWDGNTSNERAKTLVQSFTDCIERERYEPQFIDEMYALSEVLLNADTGIQLDSKNALRAADGMCKKVSDCRILDAARRSCFFMQRAKIAAKEDRVENALSLGAAAVMQAQRKGVSESHLYDVSRELIAIPNVRWPEAYKWHAAKDAPLRQRWFVNMEVANDDRISSDARMQSAIAALHDAKDETQILVASQKVNELWDDEVATPEYSEKRNVYEQFINQANLEPDEVKRVECAKNAVKFALSPQRMFDAAIHVVNNARKDDNMFEYYLALAHLSTQNETWRKHLVDAACFKRGISTTNLDEYVKSYTRDFTGLGYGNSMEMQSVRYPPAAHTQTAPAIGMGNSAPESSYGRPGPSGETTAFTRGRSMPQPVIDQPPAELRAPRAGQGSEMLRRSEFRDLITRPPGPDNGRGRGGRR